MDLVAFLDDFGGSDRLGILNGIVFGKFTNNLPVAGAETGSSVENFLMCGETHKMRNDFDTKAAQGRGFESVEIFVDEARTDDEVGSVLLDWFDEIFDVIDAVLAIAVELNGDIIIVGKSIFVASLDGAANAEIVDEVYNGDVIFVTDFAGVIGGTVINN